MRERPFGVVQACIGLCRGVLGVEGSCHIGRTPSQWGLVPTAALKDTVHDFGDNTHHNGDSDFFED
jgi:hypothetical protein